MDVNKQRTRSRSPRRQTWSIQSPHDDTLAERRYLSSRMSLTRDQARKDVEDADKPYRVEWHTSAFCDRPLRNLPLRFRESTMLRWPFNSLGKAA